ncbi:hypothetical protein HII31_05940 [Pseudocercospora fuligena]|uniref:Uncharacterized protein n=1 Tax=Pseudocercospora fuligena TaxID=685502 RepID=A0A8H6RLT1_9PEZI|nr:hypothetical protein HII31_06238 [Pseudocercospora fuligena]KAF7192714.1 hypothetical protein HII31_05940 [Pseudocercospora fuligena]
MDLNNQVLVPSPSTEADIKPADRAITMSDADLSTTQATTMSDTDQPARISQDSPLLSLPPELRNQIYDLILISPLGSKPTITGTFSPPPLLSVCSQIRSEALKLWLSANVFSITILDCDVSLAKKFQNTFTSTSGLKEAPKMSFRMKGSPHWGNLMKWCEAVHKGDTTWFQCKKEGAKGLSVVVTAATRMAGTPGRKGWDRVREDLEGWRHVAGMVDEGWLVDDDEGEKLEVA